MDDHDEIIQDSQSSGNEPKESSPPLLNFTRRLIIWVCCLSLFFSTAFSISVYDDPLYSSKAWMCFLPGFIIPLLFVIAGYLVRQKNERYNLVILTWILLIYNSLFLIPAFSDVVWGGFQFEIPTGALGRYIYYTILPFIYRIWLITPGIILVFIILAMKKNRLLYSASIQVLGPMILVHFLMIMAIPQLQSSRRGAWHTRCIKTLEALARNQFDYAQANEQRFGTWQDLIDKNLIQQGYNRTNLIDNYSIAAFITANPNIDSNMVIAPSFSIVAIPGSVKNRLRTFAICEDQHPRMWMGDESSFDLDSLDLQDDKLWRPLR
jgi:hypothetical protein